LRRSPSAWRRILRRALNHPPGLDICQVMLTNVVAPTPDAVALASKDLDAFARLFEAQRPRAIRLAYAMTGDAALAEDVVAEAFARTFRQWSKGTVREPEFYVRRAVVNEVRVRWRRQAVRRKHEAREPRVEATTGASDDRIVDADVLQRALMQLPERQRAVVVFRIVEDMSERETAAALGIAAGTVKAQLSRGLDRLRDALTALGGAPDA
jgi:RNA polymerase sigma-70 factor (sigma-E family)